jgi:hypothetical protein
MSHLLLSHHAPLHPPPPPQSVAVITVRAAAVAAFAAAAATVAVAILFVHTVCLRSLRKLNNYLARKQKF